MKHELIWFEAESNFMGGRCLRWWDRPTEWFGCQFPFYQLGLCNDIMDVVDISNHQERRERHQCLMRCCRMPIWIQLLVSNRPAPTFIWNVLSFGHWIEFKSCLMLQLCCAIQLWMIFAISRWNRLMAFDRFVKSSPSFECFELTQSSDHGRYINALNFTSLMSESDFRFRDFT